MIQLNLHEDITKDLLTLLIKKKEAKLDVRATKVREIQGIDSDIALINQEISKIESALSTGGDKVKTATDVTNYSNSLTWIQKAAFALDLLHKKSTTVEIVERLLKLEPTLNRKKGIASISSIFSTVFNKKDNPFTKGSNERGENTYGLKKWEIDVVPLM